MAEEQQAPVASIGPQEPTQSQLSPHRGTLILVLGILGIVCCFICGIVAWVMGNKDLKQMAAETMDRSGEGLTKAGKICGMVGVILAIVGIVLQLILMLLGLGFGMFTMHDGPSPM